MKKMNRILFLLLLMIGTTAIGQVITESLKPFDEIKATNAVQVLVIPSDENKIVISGYSKDKVEYDINDGILEIKLSLNNVWSDDNTIIEVFAKNVRTLDANAGSRISVKGLLSGPELTFRSQEGGGISASIEADKVSSKAVTGGVVDLSGEAQEQQVEVNTGGRFVGKDLITEITAVSCGTAGRAEVFAEEYCKAKATLGGIVVVHGDPQKLDTKTNLGGKIID